MATNHLLVSVKCMEKVDTASRITINRADMLKTVRSKLSKSEPTNWSRMETVTVHSSNSWESWVCKLDIWNLS